jgi:hypothetical protein
VTGQNGVYHVHGSIRGADAKQLGEYQDDPHGWGRAWFIPQHRLTTWRQ